jgi:hypothetical protein
MQVAKEGLKCRLDSGPEDPSTGALMLYFEALRLQVFQCCSPKLRLPMLLEKDYCKQAMQQQWNFAHCLCTF